MEQFCIKADENWKTRVPAEMIHLAPLRKILWNLETASFLPGRKRKDYGSSYGLHRLQASGIETTVFAFGSRPGVPETVTPVWPVVASGPGGGSQYPFFAGTVVSDELSKLFRLVDVVAVNHEDMGCFRILREKKADSIIASPGQIFYSLRNLHAQPVRFQPSVLVPFSV